MAELQTDNNEEVIDALLHRIESKSSTDTVNSLKRINKILKREEFRNVFAEKGGIKRLISRLEAGLSEHASPSSATTVVNVKLKNDIIELILCTLVTAALKDESCKEKICILGGLKILENVLLQVSKESIIKTCCSLIIILSSDVTVNFIRSSPGLVPTLVNILPIYEDKMCSIAILRCLWSVCSDEQSILRALRAIGFPSVVKMLECEQARLAKAALKVLYRFLKPGIDIVSDRVLELDGLKSLLSLQKRMSEDDGDELDMTSDCLYFMVQNPRVRVSVCATDFIESCTQELSNEPDSRRFTNALLSLCLCAMEAMNRVRMRMSGALEKLVRLLGDSKYSKFHSQIVSTFVCFLFDDLSLDVMLRSGLLLHLFEYFARIVKLRAEKGLKEMEEDPLISSDASPSSASSHGQSSVSFTLTKIHGARGIFQDVILILSKLSQTRAVNFMVRDCCIDPLLDYMRTSIHHDQKAEKILSRIIKNPLFFELILKLGIAQSIYCQLISGISIKNLALEIEKVLSQHYSREDEKSAGLDTSSISVESLLRMKKCTTVASASCEEPNKASVDDTTVNKEEAVYIEAKESNNVLDTSRKLPSPETVTSAQTLMRTLVLHATSSFGQGVLTHGLLSDSDEIRESFTMAFCFLCSRRSPKFLRKIFVELGGLSLLSSLLRKSQADDTNFLHGVLAYHGLAAAIALNVDDLSEAEMSKNDGEKYLRPCKKLKLDEDACSAQESGSQCCIFSNLFHSSPSENSSGLNSSETLMNSKKELDIVNSKNQNICFRVEECVIITVDREVVTNGSPVFAAMLSSNFLDSSLPFISIKDVFLSSFLILVHHMYGCSIDLDTFACREKCLYQEYVRVEETERRPASECKQLQQCNSNPVNRYGHAYDKSLTARKIMRKLYPNHHRCCCFNVLTPKQDISLIIETLRISDRYLIDDLKMKCEKNLARRLLNDTVDVIYVESVRCQAKLLSTYCVKYLLVKMCTLDAYVSAATSILLSSEKDQFIDDLNCVLRNEIMSAKEQS